MPIPAPKVPFAILSLALCLFSGTLAGAQEKKSDNDKHVFRLETDSGRYGISAEKLDPKRLGVDIYPGARIQKDKDDDTSGGSLAFDWGQQSTRLYVQKYVTGDSADKVLAFYRKQLSKYGKVLECRDGKPLAPVESELKCNSDKHDKGKVNVEGDSNGIELKVGTESKQHIVGVTPKTGATEFGIVYLEQQKRGEL